MDSCSMFLQTAISSKASTTNFTFESFLPFINCSNMLFQITLRAKLVIQMSHLNCLFPSWSAATWVFKLPFCSKLALQMSHLNCFFPSWTVAICVFKWPLCPKLESHIWIVSFLCELLQWKKLNLLTFYHIQAGFLLNFWILMVDTSNYTFVQS